jgi:hypothetical protein
MSIFSRALAVGLVLSFVWAGPVAADKEPTAIRLTPEALVTIDEGELAVTPVGPAQELSPAVFALPVVRVSVSDTGKLRAIRLGGGLRLSGDTAPLDLTKLRVNLSARRASVKDSVSGLRVAAFDVGALKVTQRWVRGTLLIAPGASAVFNEQFDTYVFRDGLQFARFSYPLK